MYGIWQQKEQCWTSVTIGKDSKAAFDSKEIAEQYKKDLVRRFPEVQFEVREWR